MTTTEAVEEMVIVLGNITRSMEIMVDRFKELEYRVKYLEIQFEKLESMSLEPDG